MRKYKKRLAGMILCAAMAGNLLTGCSSSGDSGQQGADGAGTAGSQVQETQGTGQEKETEAPAASGKSENVPEIRLVSWMTPSDPKTNPVDEAIMDFAADHSSVFSLEHENILGDELKAKIKTDVASNTVPDVFLYWGSGGNSAMLLDADVIIPFDEYLEASTQIKRELFDQFQLELPKTLDDMIAVGQVFYENGIVPFAMGSKGGNPAHEFAAEILGQMPDCQEDFRMINEEYTVDTPNIRKTFEIIQTMRENHLFPADTISIGDWDQHFAMYNEGKAAMIYAWTWQLSNMSQEMADKTVIIPAPVMPGGTRDTANFARSGGDMGYVISRNAWEDPDKRAAIITLVDYLYSKEIQELVLYSGGGIPSRLDTEVDASRVATPKLAEVINFAKGKESCPNLPQACPKTECWTDFADGIDELMAGISTVEQVLENIDQSLAGAKEN